MECLQQTPPPVLESISENFLTEPITTPRFQSWDSIWLRSGLVFLCSDNSYEFMCGSFLLCWNILFPWSHPSPLASIIFLSPLPHRSLSPKQRAILDLLMKNSRRQESLLSLMDLQEYYLTKSWLLYSVPYRIVKKWDYTLSWRTLILPLIL